MKKTILAIVHVSLIAACVGQSAAFATTYVGVDLYTLQAPAGLPTFTVRDAYGGQVGGRASNFADNFHAVLWSGPAGAPVDLTPTGVTSARVAGVVAGQQVGSITPEI